MAFWGVELKPGKPYVHRYEDDQGRLRLSQATLGSGTATKKTIVQCKVGDNMPINLCSLLPEKLENCALHLEFEEDEDVTFSVAGPHSVHLSGFFFGEAEDSGDLDPFDGEAMESESESDDSLEYDSEDEDEFTDGDDDIDLYARNSGVKIEEILDDDEKPTKEDITSKQSKKKKNQKCDPNNNEDSEKQLVVRGTSGDPVLESEDEDGFPLSSPSKRQTDDVTFRLSTATKDEPTGGKAQHKKAKEDFGHDKSLKRKIDVVELDDDPLREIGSASDQGADTTDTAPVKDSKKKKKKKNKKEKTVNKDDIGHESNGKGSTPQELNSADTEQMPATKKEKEKEKKKKKNEKVAASDGEKLETSGSPLELGEKAGTKPLQVRNYSNGLVTEELAMGKPDGKKAAPGRKVSVHYIGKLKKNGQIFDSNIGKAPFKFRLGIGQVIKGWDVGVNGMRVGDKRRLTIPPAMGYGAKGAGGAIPPNAWLVFDVELVDVN